EARVIFIAAPREAAAYRPQSPRNRKKRGVSHQPRRAPVAIGEWVYPRQPLVGTGDFHDLLVPCAFRDIRFLITIEKTRNRFRYRRDVAAYVHLFASNRAGLDDQPVFRGSILRRQASIHRLVRTQRKSFLELPLALG